MTPAASASSPTSRAGSRTTSSREGLQILVNLDHRGAVGADPLVGDGAGCLIQIPDALLRDWADEAGVDLPPPGHYAVAMCFLPQDEKARAFAIKQLEHFVKVEKQTLLGWRDVPTDTTGLGKAVIERMPVIRQAIVGRGPKLADQDAFERKILAIRKQTQNPLVELAKKHKLPGLSQLYMPSLLDAHGRLQGPAAGAAGRQLLRGPAQSADRVGALPGAPALLDQHLPVLAAGAPLPLHRPQRRDQHRARQRQLDVRAPAHDGVANCSAPTSTRCGR